MTDNRTDTRPVLLGLNNPLSSRPEHALYPYPPGCTGWRIWQMLTEKTGCSKSQYMRAFDRRNLVSELTWDRGSAEAAARLLWADPDLRGREVVVLGADTRRALDLPELLIHPQVIGDITWRQVPHPSGRNRFYNDPKQRAVVVALLCELYRTVHLPEYS